jgi:hypothetical protein
MILNRKTIAKEKETSNIITINDLNNNKTIDFIKENFYNDTHAKEIDELIYTMIDNYDYDSILKFPNHFYCFTKDVLILNLHNYEVLKSIEHFCTKLLNHKKTPYTILYIIMINNILATHGNKSDKLHLFKKNEKLIKEVKILIKKTNFSFEDYDIADGFEKITAYNLKNFFKF